MLTMRLQGRARQVIDTRIRQWRLVFSEMRVIDDAIVSDLITRGWSRVAAGEYTLTLGAGR